MFRRRWSGLPEDPVFPADLKELGYFIHAPTDEIRLIKEETYYFNYFITRSTRYNDCQRFAFNTAVVQVIHARLEALGLTKLALPLGTRTDEPHVPIYLSRDLATKKRVVVFVGEGEQELGVLAHRVVSGPGGVDKGSLVSIVRALQQQQSSGTDTDTGFVLANAGELYWWPRGGRGLTPRGSQGAPMKSCAHWGRFYDPRANAVPQNRDVDQHVRCVFESVLGNDEFVSKDARVEVIGIADGAEAVERFLDRNWDRHDRRWNVGCLAILGAPNCDAVSLRSEAFKKFLRERARIYITCHLPANTPISGPDGNPNTAIFTKYGCPVLSSGEEYRTEMALIKAKDAVLAWMEEVYKAGTDYANPELEVTFADGERLHDEGEGEGDTAWAGRDAAGGGEGGLEIITREDWEERQKQRAGRLEEEEDDDDVAPGQASDV